MPTMQFSEQQVFDLVEQLPDGAKSTLFQRLLDVRWPTWSRLSDAAQEGTRRAAAERGMNWDTMNDEARLDFINDLVHENRKCR